MLRRIFPYKNLHRPRLYLLVYHRVLPVVDFNPLDTIVSLDTFTSQIEGLMGRYPVISLSEAVGQSCTKRVKHRKQIVLTFDDGYKDNYEVVFPILRERGLPAVFFLVTDYIGRKKPLWDWEIVTTLKNDRIITRLEIEGKVIHQRRGESRLSFAFRVMERLKGLSSKVRGEFITSLRERADKKPDEWIEDSCMTWEEVKEMNTEGMEIGAHSLSHPSLARLTPQEAIYEIRQSKRVIEENLSKPCVHFAFPFGSKKDYNHSLIKYVRQVGYKTCILNVHGYNHLTADSFCLKRIIMTETTDWRSLIR